MSSQHSELKWSGSPTFVQARSASEIINPSSVSRKAVIASGCLSHLIKEEKLILES